MYFKRYKEFLLKLDDNLLLIN